MRSIFEFHGVYLHKGPVDGRKGINGLSCIVQEGMKGDVFSGSLFCFTTRRKDTIRLLYWDKTGFAMWVKKLEEEKFRWPLRDEREVVTLTTQQLSWLLDGLDILRMKPHSTLHFSAVS